MTVQQSLDKLEMSYIVWMEKHNRDRDAGYIWWERMKHCEEWSTKERTYVPMSLTKTLSVMREWVKHQKSFG